MTEANSEKTNKVINDCCGDPSDCSHYEKGTCPEVPEERRVDAKAMENIRTLWDC